MCAQIGDVGIHDPMQILVTNVEGLTLTTALPVLFFGGSGDYCRITLNGDQGKEVIKAFFGIGMLALLYTFQIFRILGRSKHTLRIANVGVTVFGLAAATAVSVQSQVQVTPSWPLPA